MLTKKKLYNDLSVKQIEQKFLSYYQSLDHKIIPGSSLLDPSVPMTFVMSAGLAQVESSANLNGGRNESRYTLIQNCFRYFDMDRIGISPIHLSLFQMPGAFTFGQISKTEAIARIFCLLTEVFSLPTEQLRVTWFGGDKVGNIYIEPDSETYDAWLNVGVPQNHIFKRGAEDNFWKQSLKTVGPDHVHKCGPHTEVFFDQGEHLSCGPACEPGCECSHYIEILNTLFITLHMDDDAGLIRNLEEPFTETVVGAERIAMLLQNTGSVFETDAFLTVIHFIYKYLPKKPLSDVNQKKHVNIIADHIRAILFLVADGAPPPGKGGRARLMRKLIRELITSRKILNIRDDKFMSDLISYAKNIWSCDNPRILEASGLIEQYLKNEAEKFGNTLSRGYGKLCRMISQKQTNCLDHNTFWEFRNLYGIPNPLLKKWLKDLNICYDAINSRPEIQFIQSI